MLKDTSKVFLGNSVSSLLAIVFSILAARFLGPEGWGLVAAVGSLVVILIALGDLGIGSSVLRFVSKAIGKNKQGEAKRILGILFSIRLGGILALFLLIVLISPYLSNLIFHSTDLMFIWLSILGASSFLLLDLQIVTFQARQNWMLAAIFLSLTNVLRVVLLLFNEYLGITSVLSTLTVFSGSPLVIWILSLFWQTNRPSLNFDQNIFRAVVPFSSWMAINKIASSVNSRIDVLLLVALMGANSAGIYAAANRLAMGVPLVIGSFAAVLAPKFASAGNRNQLQGFFYKAILFSLLLTGLLILGIFISPLIIYLFGESYNEAGFVLQGLLLALIPFVLATPATNMLIYHFQKPQVISLLSLFNLPIILFINLNYISSLGVFAPVIALFISNLIMFFVTLFLALKYLQKVK